MGIQFKQIDNLIETFDHVSGTLQTQVTSNNVNIVSVMNSPFNFKGHKYFENNVDFSGAQGILIASDSIYTPNNLFAGGAKIGFSISSPRNNTPDPIGSLQVSGGQIYFEDQLNIRNNAGINIENGSITGLNADFNYITGSSSNLDLVTGRSLSYASGDFTDSLTLSGAKVATGDINFYYGNSGISLIGDTFVTTGIANFHSIDLVPTTVVPQKEGRLFYDSVESSLILYNDENDISLQLGRQQHIKVLNNTSVDIPVGSVVRVNGAQGDQPTISLASANSEINAQAMGLAAHTIGQNSAGYVTTQGVIYGLNTTGFNAGDEIHLSTSSGDFTTGLIESPNYRVSVGHVLRNHENNGQVLVQVGQPKLGGGDVKSLSTVNVSGINYYDSAADSAGILGSSNSFVYNDTSGFVGLGTGDPKGILDINSTVSAPIMPRMTSSQMNGISSPIQGMIVYNTDAKKFAGYSDNSWSLLQEEWTPEKLTLNAWYDASDLSTFDLSGNYVSIWRDKSFNGNHVLQSDTGKQPVAYEQSRNGLNVLDFTPDDNLISNSSAIQNQDQTWVVLANITNVDSSADSIISYYDNSNLSGSWQLQANNSTEFRAKVLKGTSAGIPNTAFSETDLSNSYNIFSFNFDRQNQQHSNWLNGSINDDSVSDVTGVFPSMDIKIMTNRGTNNFPEGQIAEIICFSGVSIENKEKAEGYLAHKWNLTGSLNSSHPYKYIKP